MYTSAQLSGADGCREEASCASIQGRMHRCSVVPLAEGCVSSQYRIQQWQPCGGSPYTGERWKEQAMTCGQCGATGLRALARQTALGYRLFRCRTCLPTFHERTGTVCNVLAAPTEVVLLVVRWRLRSKLSLRDPAEMFLQRGFSFTHETVRAWEQHFAPLVTEHWRAKRRGKTSRSWYADEPYGKVCGRWCSLYRCIDRDGHLVDSMLSQTRDLAAAQQFFTRARHLVGRAPERVGVPSTMGLRCRRGQGADNPMAW
jgi:DDE superfamily endonuclease